MSRKQRKNWLQMCEKQKSDNDSQFTKSAGSEFHSVIDLGKKENLKTSLDTSGILCLKAWLLRVLFSLFGIK